MKGAVVAMVPSTGEVLAMYSNPSYDPNDFVGGIRNRLWRRAEHRPRQPLLDRTMAGIYPPASTFKLATAIAGVQAGILTQGHAACRSRAPGGMAYAGRYARCWWSAGHGSLDLATAIEKSCNVYFYQVGIRLGLKELTARGARAWASTGRRGSTCPAGEVRHLPGQRPEYLMKKFNYIAPVERDEPRDRPGPQRADGAAHGAVLLAPSPGTAPRRAAPRARRGQGGRGRGGSTWG